MPPLTPEALAKARATRAQNQATQPLYMLAKVLKTKPETLRAKLLYHKQKTSGVTLAALVNTLETKTRERLSAAQRRRLGLGEQPPPVLSNPRAEAPAPKGNGRSKNLRLAIIALSSVEKMILPLQPGHYGQRELYELEALHLLRTLDKP